MAVRVGFLTYGMSHNLTGIGRYTQELTYALRWLDAGIDVVLLNPYPDSALPWYRDFEVHHIPALQLLPGVVALGSPKLALAARKLRLDLLHDPCGVAPFLAPRLHVRRVVTIHDAIPYVHPQVQPFFTHVVFRTLIPVARWTADAIVTVSEASRRDLMRHASLPASRISVIPPGVRFPGEADLAVWKARLQCVRESQGITGPYFLYVGALNPRKNLPRLLAALSKVRNRHPNVQLVVVGPSSWGAEELLTGMRRMGDAVRLTGFVDDDTLHVLYVGAVAFVFPSLYEGFGLPPLEAMAHGTPVITSKTSSLPEVVGDAGILIDPEKHAEIAAAMDRVLEDPILARHLAHAGRERASHFTWETTARKMLSVYERIVGRRSMA